MITAMSSSIIVAVTAFFRCGRFMRDGDHSVTTVDEQRLVALHGLAR